MGSQTSEIGSQRWTMVLELGGLLCHGLAEPCRLEDVVVGPDPHAPADADDDVAQQGEHGEEHPPAHGARG